MRRFGVSEVRGEKWWTCGNGSFRDFHETAGSHFQADLLEMEEVQGNGHLHISKVISADMLTPTE
jgi:hypothetical protein